MTLENTVNNDTGFAWTAYYADVYLNTTFTLSDPVVLYGATTVPGWYASPATPQTASGPIGSGPYAGDYEAQGQLPAQRRFRPAASSTSATRFHSPATWTLPRY